MGKLKNAPHVAEQPKEPFEEQIILAGSGAWQAWNKGDGEAWKFFCMAIMHDERQKPVILGETQLDDIPRLKLAATGRQYIKIAVFGDLTAEQKTALCLNLAANTQAQSVQLVNNIGDLTENLSGYIKRLRQDDEAAQIAARITPEPKYADPINFDDKPTQPAIAEAFLDWHDKPIRHDSTTDETFEYNGQYWEMLPKHFLRRKIMTFYDQQGNDRYTARHLAAIADLVAIKAEALPPQSPDFIGFQNGVLNKKTGAFLPHDIDHYLRGIEKVDCNIHDKSTPHFDDWIDFVCNGSEAKKQAILAGLYMVLTNRHEWGLFLEATGTAGAGKSIFSQIAATINGTDSTGYISLQELEDDRKRGMLLGKSLAISPDQKPYKGSADELKAITGGDNVTVRLVYVNHFSARLTPVFMLVTNYPLLFTDRNGGIARRRIIIPFDRAIPKDKKDVHFIDKVKAEVYGIVNKLLVLFPDPNTALFWKIIGNKTTARR